MKIKCINCKKLKESDSPAMRFCSLKCRKEYKEYGHTSKNKSYIYYCRKTVTSKNRKPVYGITIPRRYVDKYHLLKKQFKIYIDKDGKFVLYSLLKRDEKVRYKSTIFKADLREYEVK